MTKPSLSVIIASYNSRPTIAQCLRALESQLKSNPGSVEVILVDSAQDGTAEFVAAQFPWVKLYSFPTRKYPGEARNIGLCHARGDIIVFLDADCVVDKSWLAEILAAHESNLPAIGGAVDNGNPESYVGWGYYFCEFTQWAPQMPAGTMIEVPTCSLSIKRWAFDRYGPFLESGYCSDTAFNWRLGRDGHWPVFNPKIKVAHLNPRALGQFLAHGVEHGRAFAALRVREKKFTNFKCLIYSLGAPVLPWLLFGRVLGRVVVNRIYRRKFFATAPLVMAGLIAWSLGELLGYLRLTRTEFSGLKASQPV